MNTLKPIYNKLNIRQILSKLPLSFSKGERNQYIKNCIEVYKNESSGINLGLNELIKNSNFMMVNNHFKSL